MNLIDQKNRNQFKNRFLHSKNDWPLRTNFELTQKCPLVVRTKASSKFVVHSAAKVKREDERKQEQQQQQPREEE